MPDSTTALQELINSLGSNTQVFIPPTMDEATARRVVAIQNALSGGYKKLMAQSLGLPEDATDRQLVEAAGGVWGQDDLTRLSRPYQEQLDSLNRDLISINNKYETDATNIARAVLGEIDPSSLPVVQQLAVYGPPSGLNAGGTYTVDQARQVLQTAAPTAGQTGVFGTPSEDLDILGQTGGALGGYTNEQQVFDSYQAGRITAEQANQLLQQMGHSPANAAQLLANDAVSRQPQGNVLGTTATVITPDPDSPPLNAGPSSPSIGQQAGGQIPMGAPLNVNGQWFQWNGNDWTPASQEMIAFLDQNGITNVTFPGDGTVIFLDADGNQIGTSDAQGNFVSSAGTGQSQAGGTGDTTGEGGGFDLSSIFGQRTGVLQQAPPWWDDSVFGAFENYTPSQVEQIFEQAQAGQWGQAGLATVQGFFTPDQPGQDIPSLDEIMSQLILSRNFDAALELQDFRNRATPEQQFNAALDLARSPADSFTVSNILAGNLPMTSGGLSAREALSRIIDPSLPQHIQQQMQDAFADLMGRGQPASDILGQLGFSPEQIQQFQDMTTPSVQRIGAPSSFLQDSFNRLFGTPEFGNLESALSTSPFQPVSGTGTRPDIGGAIGAVGGASQQQDSIARFLDVLNSIGGLQLPPGIDLPTIIQQALSQNNGLPPEQSIGIALLNAGAQFPPGTNLTPYIKNALDYSGLARPDAGAAIGAVGPGGTNVSSSNTFGGAFTSPTTGLLTTPRLENLVTGAPQSQPASLFTAANIRTPSPQQLLRSSPTELAQFQEITRLAGIPEDEFQREITRATPFASRPSQPVFAPITARGR